ncbi:hypothetical protein KRX11_02325 [Pasteurellaceae bacterium TAE3-ERU1]|nr:hypothetical protein [Pasteurellaceae bacterium TAE3-ERU1]
MKITNQTNQNQPIVEIEDLGEFFYQVYLRVQVLQTRNDLVAALAADTALELSEIYTSLKTASVLATHLDKDVDNADLSSGQTHQKKITFANLFQAVPLSDQMSVNDELLYKVVGQQKHHNKDRKKIETYKNYSTFTPKQIEYYRLHSWNRTKRSRVHATLTQSDDTQQTSAPDRLFPSLEFFIEQATRHNPAFLSEMRGNAPRNQLLADVFAQLSQLADKPLAQTHSITRVNDVPQRESSTHSTFQAPSAPPEVLVAVFEAVQQFYRSDRSLGQILKLSQKLNRIWLKAYRKKAGGCNENQ